MDKRYQVFVSSTFTDLKDERQKVIQTLMDMDCIPAGMEMFPAMDEEQFSFIKRVIDDCDYYLLIVGGRYGSLSPQGISYTEQEYDYAVEKKLKVVALLHGSPGKIAFDKSESSPELREKLQAFRDKAGQGRLVRFWNSDAELPGLVSLSLQKTIKTYPAIGWIRADRAASEEILSEINKLRKENTRLIEQIESAQTEQKFSRASANLNPALLVEKFEVHGTYWTDRGEAPWRGAATWSSIFNIISPYLIENPDHDRVKKILQQGLKSLLGYGVARSFYIDDQDFQTISIQLRALGLVEVKSVVTVTGTRHLLWNATPAGDSLMFALRVVRASSTLPPA